MPRYSPCEQNDWQTGVKTTIEKFTSRKTRICFTLKVNVCQTNFDAKYSVEQESIPVGCVPPARPPYVLQKTSDVSIWRGYGLDGHTPPPPRQNNTRLWKHYLSATSLAGGKCISTNRTNCIVCYMWVTAHPSRTIFSEACVKNSVRGGGGGGISACIAGLHPSTSPWVWAWIPPQPRPDPSTSPPGCGSGLGGGLQAHTRVFFSQKLFSMWHSKWQRLLSCLHIIFTSGESCYYRQMLWLRLYYIYIFFEFFFELGQFENTRLRDGNLFTIFFKCY